MSLDLQDVEKAQRAAGSAGLQREHALEVPAHRHQVPLAFDVAESSQEKLPVNRRAILTRFGG